jgi:hypothetical protein
MPNLPNKLQSGQSLIGILIAMAVFSILSHAIFTVGGATYSFVSFNRARIAARHIAQEKMEVIRNIPYSDLGTVGGIPGGALPQEEVIVRNGLAYTVRTSIIFVDDPFDGLAPDDTSPEDYIRARVEVSWEGLASSRRNPVVLITDISAFATSNVEGGALLILVFDAQGSPVPQADVTIISTEVDPAVNTTQRTDSNGRVILPGALPCITCYQISVTKAGFSTDRTYSFDEVANPIKSHASIFEDDITQISFTIDTLGELTIHSFDTRENEFAPLGNVIIRLRSNKTIGTDAFATPIYKYDESLTTTDEGSLIIPDLEWDVYHVLMPDDTVYDISGTSPLLPLYLSPSGTLNFDFSVNTQSDHSLIASVKDGSLNLVESVTVRIYDAGGFEAIEETGSENDPDFGQVFFPSLDEKSYDIEINADGFMTYIGKYDVSGYTRADIVLTAE